MTIACPIDLDTAAVRREISSVYGRVAAAPDGQFHFHRGPRYASEFLGYDPAELALLPPESTASFAGIANPHAIHPIREGETVLDIGCGAGTDLLLAARKAGPRGKAIGVDMTEAMLQLARRSAASAGLMNVDLRLGDATDIPAGDAEIDVVISNGVLNLVPEKERAFAEILRVLKPAGRLQLGDIALDMELSDDVRRNIDLWAG
ncbi:MAG: methyltransferase domain-containing protein [Bryobacteraceae bacterium]|nr:methyltransferase domain-containing protein [Bryobacteraceae bacterium]